MWSIAVTGAGNPRVYGAGRMATYQHPVGPAEVLPGPDRPTVGAGKTIEIDLFDPGDLGQAACMRILSPDNNVYTPATFDFTTDSRGTSLQATPGSSESCSRRQPRITPPTRGPNDTSTASSSDNTWLHIIIPLPVTYGSVGAPTGEPVPGGGRSSTRSGGNDTTTWQVNGHRQPGPPDRPLTPGAASWRRPMSPALPRRAERPTAPNVTDGDTRRAAPRRGGTRTLGGRDPGPWSGARRHARNPSRKVRTPTSWASAVPRHLTRRTGTNGPYLGPTPHG